MRKIIAALSVCFLVLSLQALPASAGGKAVLKKGTSTIVIYKSRSDANKHWLERSGYRSKKNGSASSAIRKYLARGYKRTGRKKR